MFCKQCGKRIEADTRQCPYCGRPADVLSGGTGFWNLTQTPPPASQPVQQAAPQIVPQPIPAQPPVQVPQPTPVQSIPETPDIPEEALAPRRSGGLSRLLPLFMGVVILILLIAVIILSSRVGNLKDKLSATQAELAQQEVQTEVLPEPPAQESPEAPVPEASAQEEAPVAATPADEPTSSSEPSPSAAPTPSAEPTPEPAGDSAPAPEEQAEDSQEAPAVTAKLSRDWSSITLTVDKGDLEIESFEWIVVYDPTLSTTEEVLEVLDRAAIEEEETVRSTLISQADPYDASSGRHTQKIPLEEFYQTSDNYTKRMFCKMTLASGQAVCSQMVEPVIAATQGCVTTTQIAESVMATALKLPSSTTDEVSCYWMEIDPATDTETMLEPQVFAEGLEMEITMVAGKQYFFVMEKDGLSVITTPALALATQNRLL